MKTAVIVAITAGALVAAAVVVTIVFSTGNLKDDRAAGKRPSVTQSPTPAPMPDAPVSARKPKRPEPANFEPKDFKAPEPIKKTDYVRNAVKFGVQKKVQDPGNGRIARPMMPVTGPAAADRVVGKAKMLRNEGRQAEAQKLLQNALRTETNPYYRKLIENEIKTSQGERAPAEPGSEFK